MASTLHPMGPSLLLFSSSGTELQDGRRAGLLLVSHVENTSGGECLQTLRTPETVEKAACSSTGGCCPFRVRAKTFLLH